MNKEILEEITQFLFNNGFVVEEQNGKIKGIKNIFKNTDLKLKKEEKQIVAEDSENLIIIKIKEDISVVQIHNKKEGITVIEKLADNYRSVEILDLRNNTTTGIASMLLDSNGKRSNDSDNKIMILTGEFYNTLIIENAICFENSVDINIYKEDKTAVLSETKTIEYEEENSKKEIEIGNADTYFDAIFKFMSLNSDLKTNNRIYAYIPNLYRILDEETIKAAEFLKPVKQKTYNEN